MLHPSYNDLIEAVNNDADSEAPVINSRYSIVLAAAKRARQIIDGAEPLTVGFGSDEKPLSIAISELNNSKVKILSEAEED